jgi:lysyl-tRNA synthetase class 2
MAKGMDLDRLRTRARALSRLRGFFEARGYLEVDTPLLAPFLIPEATLEVFAVSGRPGPLYLTPSPELWMKRLLCAGSGSIFQLCRSFRSGEPDSPLHLPEFTMLEWYTVGADYTANIAVQEALVDELRAELGFAETICIAGASVNFSPPFPRITVVEAFRKHLGLELSEHMGRESLAREVVRRGLSATPEDSWADLFHKLFLGCVEPLLPRDRPVFLTDYPAELATLARLRPGSLWAERWELYIAGVEIANCYTEETDPGRVEAFFESQTALKRSSGQPHPVDWELARLIGRSLPPCSGVALGVDRLLALLLDESSIASVTPYSLREMMKDAAWSGDRGFDRHGPDRHGPEPRLNKKQQFD